jgi:hypothetical protein
MKLCTAVLAIACCSVARAQAPPDAIEARLDVERPDERLRPPPPSRLFELVPAPARDRVVRRPWSPLLVYGGLIMTAIGWTIPALYGAMIHDGTWAIPIAGPGIAWSRPSQACAGGDGVACPLFAGFGEVFASVFWGLELAGVALAAAGLVYFPKVRVPLSVSSTGKSAALTIRF